MRDLRGEVGEGGGDYAARSVACRISNMPLCIGKRCPPPPVDDSLKTRMTSVLITSYHLQRGMYATSIVSYLSEWPLLLLELKSLRAETVIIPPADSL